MSQGPLPDSQMSRYRTKVPDLTRDLIQLADELLEAAEEHSARPSPPDPEKLRQKVQDFCILLRQVDSLRSRDTAMITDMADYGLYLLQNLSDTSSKLEARRIREELNCRTIAFAVWAASSGGTLREIDGVVNAFAAEANQLREQKELKTLCRAMGEVVRAVDPQARIVGDEPAVTSPWRLLNINRGITATRSRDPDLMEESFEDLVRNVPNDAPEFFREGMEQMGLLGYPAQVREVMERYYNRWCSPPTLH